MSSSPVSLSPAPQSISPPAIHEPLVPSINFAMVCPGVYRSGYPTKKNYRFLCALRLRSILYLCPEEYAESNVKFCEENNIEILRFPTEGNKEPFMDISECLLHRILSTLIDTRKHPILIHCNKGKHRTGTVVACLRLLQGWSLVSILHEYRSFAGDKVRVGDQQYVELYRPIVCVTPPYVAEWVCVTPGMTIVESEEELIAAETRQLGSSILAPDIPEKKEKKAKQSNGDKLTSNDSSPRATEEAESAPPAEETKKKMQQIAAALFSPKTSNAAAPSSPLFSLSAPSAAHSAEKTAAPVATKAEIGETQTVEPGTHAQTAAIAPGGRGTGFSTGKAREMRKDIASDAKRKGQRRQYEKDKSYTASLRLHRSLKRSLS